MERAIITFVNGEKLTVCVNDVLYPIVSVETEDDVFSSQSAPVEIHFHVHKGLIPAILDVLCAYKFFSTKSDCSKVYGTSSVLSVETA